MGSLFVGAAALCLTTWLLARVAVNALPAGLGIIILLPMLVGAAGVAVVASKLYLQVRYADEARVAHQMWCGGSPLYHATYSDDPDNEGVTVKCGPNGKARWVPIRAVRLAQQCPTAVGIRDAPQYVAFRAADGLDAYRLSCPGGARHEVTVGMARARWSTPRANTSWVRGWLPRPNT